MFQIVHHLISASRRINNWILAINKLNGGVKPFIIVWERLQRKSKVGQINCLPGSPINVTVTHKGWIIDSLVPAYGQNSLVCDNTAWELPPH